MLSVIFQPEGWAECPVPGWYFLDETEQCSGPYRSKQLALDALEYHLRYL
jgi:hypothetical protein